MLAMDEQTTPPPPEMPAPPAPRRAIPVVLIVATIVIPIALYLLPMLFLHGKRLNEYQGMETLVLPLIYFLCGFTLYRLPMQTALIGAGLLLGTPILCVLLFIGFSGASPLLMPLGITVFGLLIAWPIVVWRRKGRLFATQALLLYALLGVLLVAVVAGHLVGIPIYD